MEDKRATDGMDFIGLTVNLKCLEEEAEKDNDCFIIDCAWVGKQPSIDNIVKDLKKEEGEQRSFF